MSENQKIHKLEKIALHSNIKICDKCDGQGFFKIIAEETVVSCLHCKGKGVVLK